MIRLFRDKYKWFRSFARALQGNVTELELQLLMRNKSWFQNVIFHDAGKVLNNQEVVLKGIKYLEWWLILVKEF